MPSFEHEFPLDIIRHTPEVAVDLLGLVYDRPLPVFSRARCESGDATTTAPPEFRADSVVVCEHETEPALAIIVECQVKKDDRKRYSWPAYVVNLRARLQCPVALLVLAPKESVARWCGPPIGLGCGEVRPAALPLTALKPVTDPEEARTRPELAILAVVANRSVDPAVLDALTPALQALDDSLTSLYADHVLAALPAAARKYLEDTVNAGTYEYKTKLFRRSFQDGRTKGKTEGKAEDLLEFLDARGIEVPAAARERITSCTDVEQLRVWVRRAATVTRAEELFD